MTKHTCETCKLTGDSNMGWKVGGTGLGAFLTCRSCRTIDLVCRVIALWQDGVPHSDEEAALRFIHDITREGADLDALEDNLVRQEDPDRAVAPEADLNVCVDCGGDTSAPGETHTCEVVTCEVRVRVGRALYRAMVRESMVHVDAVSPRGWQAVGVAPGQGASHDDGTLLAVDEGTHDEAIEALNAAITAEWARVRDLPEGERGPLAQETGEEPECQWHPVLPTPATLDTVMRSYAHSWHVSMNEQEPGEWSYLPALEVVEDNLDVAIEQGADVGVSITEQEGEVWIARERALHVAHARRVRR